jgi:hypothetical protein
MSMKNTVVLWGCFAVLVGCSGKDSTPPGGKDASFKSSDAGSPSSPAQNLPGVEVTQCPDLSSPETKTNHPMASLSPYLEDTAQVVLQDCRLVKVGGAPVAPSFGEPSGPSALVQAYDRKTNKWTQLSPLPMGLYQESATLMPSRDVFVAGGAVQGAQTGKYEFSKAAFIYSVSKNEWRKVSSSLYPHVRHQAVVLKDGRILVIGTGTIGLYTWPSNQGTIDSYSEIYDPARDAWSSPAQLYASYYLNSVHMLNDGRILVTRYSGGSLGAEIYDLKTNSWHPTNLSVYEGVSTMLHDGTVIVAAPSTTYTSFPPSDDNPSEIELQKFDLQTSTWSALPAIHTKHRINSLRNSILTSDKAGNLLFWGGYSSWFGGLALDMRSGTTTEFGAMQSGINVSSTPVQPVMLSTGEILITPNGNTELVGLP